MPRFIRRALYWWFEQEAALRQDYYQALYWSRMRDDL